LLLLLPLKHLHVVAVMGLKVHQVAYVSWLLLWVAALLAIWSLSIYFANVWTHFVAPPQPRSKHA
jgi:hypothetical protein